MCARSEASGELMCPSEFAAHLPTPVETGYVEGDAWQWLWFVPHNASLLVSLFASPARFVEKLDEFMTRGREWRAGNVLSNPFYWAGNEPDLLAPWLYAFGGRSDRTANVTRYLVDHVYTAAADGIPGNDDYGTMSAWLVWATVGLYPLAGSDTFVVGSPRFAHVRIRLGGESAGPWLDIVAHNASGRNLYVERATINGDVLEAPLLTFSQLVRPRNATLELWMGADPAMAAWSEGGLLMMREAMASDGQL